MKNKIIKTATIGIVAFGTNVMAAESTNVTFGSTVGEVSIERQSQIKASKTNEVNNEFMISREPPHCPRQCQDWRIVKEDHNNRDLSLAEDMGSLLS